jgi:uncharacterized phiE125 gp8 family phage protein
MVKQVLVTPPDARVVTPREVANHVKFDDPEEDTKFAELSDDAQEYAEDRTWRVFIDQTWDQYFDTWYDPFRLRRPPVSAITSVKYTDVNGIQQSVSSDVYELAQVDGLSVVRLKYNQLWPTDLRGHPDDIVIRTVNGYGDPGDVPKRLRAAIRIHAGKHFRHRDGDVDLAVVDRLLYPFRVRGY